MHEDTNSGEPVNGRRWGDAVSLRVGGGAEVTLRRWEPAARSLPEGFGSTAADDLVLCLHGAESHSLWFADLGERLAANGLRVAAFDRPGWGSSRGERGHLVDERLEADRVTRVADALGAVGRPVHLLGMSWGGLLAAFTVLGHPQRFATLTLLAPGLVRRRPLSASDQMRLAWSLLTRRRVDVDLPYRPEDFTTRPSRQAMIAADSLRIRRVSSDFCWATARMTRHVLRRLDQFTWPPTLVLLARDDLIVDTVALTRRFRGTGARTVELPCGHVLVFEDLDAVIRHVVPFLRQAWCPPSGGPS